MHCLECNHPMVIPSLVIAMEQREHFAMVRHAEACSPCAHALLPILEKIAAGSRYWHQSTNCAYCGDNHPIARLRFEMKDHPHLHLAICSPCYGALRDHLIKRFPHFVTFVDKEWETHGTKGNKRLPLPNGTVVRVKQGVARFHDQVGSIQSFRCLVQPWFGYEVRFAQGQHHFFHERDLDQLPQPGAIAKIDDNESQSNPA